MARQRALRIGDEMKRILSKTIQSGMKDPRIPLFTSVTAVEVSNDLSVATCYISVLGSGKQQADCIRALVKAEGFLKSEVAKQMRLRVAPELRFSLDRSVEEGMRMDRLIDAAMGRSPKAAAGPDPGLPPAADEVPETSGDGN